MTPWVSYSNLGKQTTYALISAGLGTVLVIAVLGTRNGSADARAGLLLGVLLLVMGVLGFLFAGKQTVTVDPQMRRIVVDDVYRFGSKRRTIAFDDIADVRIGYLGKASNHVRFYYLALELKSGGECPLFAPGRGYEGASDRAVVESWRTRLQEFVRG